MLGRIYAIAVAEMRQVRRDRRSLGLLLFIPALMLVLYGYALTFDVKHIALAVMDRDNSTDSREFVAVISSSEYFDIVGTVERDRDIDSWLDQGLARAVLVVPSDFAERLRRGRRVAAQVLVDGANANSAAVAIGYLRGIMQRYTFDRAQIVLRERGMPAMRQPVALEPRLWYNPTLETSKFLVPGLVGFLLMLVGAVATSQSVVREIERGTIEQIVVSAVRPLEFIAGKTLPYLAISLFTEALIILAAMALFAVPFNGSVGWLAVSSVVFLLGALGLGLTISTIAETQQVALQISVVATMLPSLVLSDLLFPISSMPEALQWITYLIPPRHFIVIVRSVVLKGTGPSAWTVELLFLLAFAVFILTVASVKMNKRLRRS